MYNYKKLGYFLGARYFRGIATFAGSLLSELYGNLKINRKERMIERGVSGKDNEGSVNFRRSHSSACSCITCVDVSFSISGMLLNEGSTIAVLDIFLKMECNSKMIEKHCIGQCEKM